MAGAIDKPLSGLPANPGVSVSDKLMVLDVSNTANNPTGENTQATVGDIIALAGGGGGGGGSGTVTSVDAASPLAGGPITTSGTISLGTVPVSKGGTGLTALGAALQVLRVNAGATGLEFASLAGGGGGTVTDITAAAPLTGGTITGSGTIGLGTVPVAKGGTGLVALPTANQILGVNAGATAYEGKTLAAGANVTITPTPGVLTIAASGGGGGGIAPIWKQDGAGTPVQNSTSAASLLAGGTPSGSLVLAANSLAVGKIIRLRGFGSVGWTGSPDLTLTLFLLPAAYIVLAKFTALPAYATVVQFNVDAYCRIRAIGSGGTSMGAGVASVFTSAQVVTTTNFALGSQGNATTARAVDTTAALTPDLQAQWSVASSSNVITLLGMDVTIEG